MPLVLLVALAAGCAGDPGPAVAERQVATVLEPAIDLRIGIAEGDAPYLFGWLADVAALGDGTIVTADSRTGEVRRFDADGRYLGRVGASGEGPGEYGGTPTDVEALPDDRVVVLAGDRQLLLYDAGGAYESSFTVPELRRRLVGRSLWGATDGTVAVPVFTPDDEYLIPDEVWRLNGSATHLARYSADGVMLDRTPVPPARRSHMGWVMPRADGSFVPFIVETRFALGPDGTLVSGRNDAYSLRIEIPGREPLVAGRAVAAAPLVPPERAFWLAQVKRNHEWYEQVPEEARHTVQRTEEDHIPDTKPYFRDLFVDDNSRIWVHRYVTAERLDPVPRASPWGGIPMTWREPPTYDVFAPAGTFIATVVLPPRTRFTQVRGDRLWGVQADLDDVQYAVRMRIDWP